MQIIRKNSNKHGLSRETVESWFDGVDDEGSPTTGIFSGLNPYQRKAMTEKLLESRRQDFPTFPDLKYSRTRSAYTDFCGIAQEVIAWFDEDSRAGYEGGTVITKRSKAEERYIEHFGNAGFAAILLYVMRHFPELSEAGGGLKMNDRGYSKRFEYREWFTIAKVLMVKWGHKPFMPEWAAEVRKIYTNKRPLKV